MQPRDQDILFGDFKFLEQHAGTKRWAAIVGIYSRQSYWSDKVYQNIRNDKRLQGRNYLMLLLPGGGRQANKFRSATEEEIEERTCTVFNHGGGKKRSSSTTTRTTTTTMTKRRKLGHNKNTMATKDGKKNENGGNENNDAEIVFKVGDDVYAFDQLWRASIVEQSDGFDGTKYLVSYAGFRRDQDNWVDELQLFPANAETTRLYHQLDKSQLTAFENDDNGGSIMVSGTTTRSSSKRRSTNTSKKAAITKSVKTKGKSSPSPQTPVEIPPSPDLMAGEEIISHRLVVSSTTSSGRKSKKSTATTATAVALDDVIDLEQVITQAISKCKNALKQSSNEAGILVGSTTVESIVAGEVAAWTQQTLSNLFFVQQKQENENVNVISSLSSSSTILLPNAKEMEQTAKSLKEGTGGSLKRLEALALERKAKIWNEAQKHLVNFVQCLVQDL
eukprot:scaffold17050_cov79-Cylindrotheca_fusiformis.AAC.5